MLSNAPRHLTVLAFVAVACLAGACAPDRPSAPNVLLISIDTLRWDRLGCTGYEEARTPRIDALAESGVLYPNCVAATPLTLPSHGTILSGLGSEWIEAHRFRAPHRQGGQECPPSFGVASFLVGGNYGVYT